MKTRRLVAIVGLLIIGLLALGSTSAFATMWPSIGDELNIYRAGGNDHGGGEFRVRDLTKGGDYYTFCLETNEDFIFGRNNTYVVGDISEGAIAGGSGGGVPHGTGTWDPIDPRTAYLFTMFTNGTLGTKSGGLFTYDDAGKNDLQAAIWYIEQEKWGSDNYLVDLAARAGWTDIGSVRAVNLVDVAGNLKQDHLTMVPEPSMMLLFGTGLLGLGIFGRRKKN